MGCCHSTRIFVADRKINGQTPKDVDILCQLGYEPRDLNVMYSAFRQLDVTGDQEIEFAEMCAVLKLEENEFSQEIFAECDFEKSGKINFLEFCMSMWSFLARDRRGLAEFAFDVFDGDDTGKLGGEEIETMTALVYGLKTRNYKNDSVTDSGFKHNTDKHIATVMKKLDANKDGKISKKEFIERSHSLPMLLQPAFDVQESLMELCGGGHFWRKFVPIRIKKMQDPAIKKLFRRSYQKKGKGMRGKRGVKKEDLDKDADGIVHSSGHRKRH